MHNSRTAQEEDVPAETPLNGQKKEAPFKRETSGISEQPTDNVSATSNTSLSRKRTADEAELNGSDSAQIKKSKPDTPYHKCLSDPPSGSFSIFCKEDFREHFCRCPECYPLLKQHPQLLEEEYSYEPPLSESGGEGGESMGTGSLLDRGEAALSNVDRVRAIGMSVESNH